MGKRNNKTKKDELIEMFLIEIADCVKEYLDMKFSDYTISIYKDVAYIIYKEENKELRLFINPGVFSRYRFETDISVYFIKNIPIKKLF